jgi:DNA-binding Lrp family transcriptional regulator
MMHLPGINEGGDMVTAVVLVNAEHGKVNEVAENLAELPGVVDVYSVGGRLDIVVVARVKTNEEVANLVNGRMIEIQGIMKTETLVAFKAYSRPDVEAGFSLGGR